MTKKHQVKADTPEAVELNDAALDRAVGGYPLPSPVRLLETRPKQSITDGSSNTILTA